MHRTDTESIIKKYIALANEPDHRYTSFDYCYNYFQTTTDLTKDIEKSCLTIGFYLSSWGMYRGSSFLLQRSVKYFNNLIQYIDTLDDYIWEIDVENYGEKSEKIIEIYNKIKDLLIPNGNADLTLITKILLGVFGFVPAFDNNFCKTFRGIYGNKCGFRKLNPMSLTFIGKFYESNKTVIDKLSKETFTIDFMTGQKTKINYSKAKIIDMYGFTRGQKT